MSKVFLLSPAHCGGLRGRSVLRPRARSDVARRLKGEGLPLGELFTFLSGLYFRGKLAYSSTFADPPRACPGVLVITPCRGLLAPATRVSMADFILFAQGDVHEADPAFALPFARDARLLAERLGGATEIILLGSIATGKYLTVLSACFGPRLLFPSAFVGRGDMSRGGLLLRSATDGVELPYTPVEGAVLHGRRPPKLALRRHIRSGAPHGQETK